jgi:hypothetical protein
MLEDGGEVGSEKLLAVRQHGFLINLRNQRIGICRKKPTSPRRLDRLNRRMLLGYDVFSKKNRGV